MERLCGCALHKALDVPCFDKDSTAFHCLYSRGLWSRRKTFSSCLESAGLRQNMITRLSFYSLSALPVSLLSHSFYLHPTLCLMSTPPHSPNSLTALFFFLPLLVTISFDHLLEKVVEFYPMRSVSCLPPVPLIPSALHSHPSSCLNSAQLTQNQYWLKDEYVHTGVGCYFWTSGSDTTPQCLSDVTPAVAEIRPKCIRYQMVRTLKIAHSSTQGCMFHVPVLVHFLTRLYWYIGRTLDSNRAWIRQDIWQKIYWRCVKLKQESGNNFT